MSFDVQAGVEFEAVLGAVEGSGVRAEGGDEAASVDTWVDDTCVDDTRIDDTRIDDTRIDDTRIDNTRIDI